jgi:hypothetical protein
VDWSSKRRLVSNEAACEMDNCQVVRSNLLPPDQEAAVAVVPTIGALNDPSPGFLATNRADQGRLAAAPDVWLHAASPRLLLRLGVVVPLVEADVLRPPRPPGRLQNNSVEGLPEHVLVVDVGAREGDAQADPVGVGQNVALRAALCTIGGTGAREVPPFGAFTLALSSEHQLRSMPTFWS